MEYQNPKLPEGINVTDEHPLKGFFYLLVAVSFFAITIVLVVYLTVGFLVKFVPFEVEEKLSAHLVTPIGSLATNNEEKQARDSERHKRVSNYLQQLADELGQAQQLPEEIKITTHYIDKPVVNAFATLGGNIIIYQGVIDAVNSENALSMVVAHEIAHIKHRHPIVALGRGVSIGLIFYTVTGFGESGLSESIVGQVSLLTALAFSRNQEEEADIEAYKTLVNYYGHGKGAADFFIELQKTDKTLTPPELLSTHPLSERRIEKLESLEQSIIGLCGQLAKECGLTPLPSFLLKDKNSRSRGIVE